jgi:succinate dehydrogenase / fumarate reductase, cytochrome b subunit
MAVSPSRGFVFKRLHSLTGVLPIGYYLIQHLVLNFSSRLDHGNAFNRVVASFESLPWYALLAIEILVLAIPILYHSAYGVYVTLRGRAEPLRYTYGRNWMYVAQRVTGIVVFVFMAIHVWQMTIHPRMTASELNFRFVHAVVSQPVWFAAYLTGVACAVFHLANGMWSFCITWGVTIGPRAQRVSAIAFGLVGLALFAIGVGSLQGFLANAPYQTGAHALGMVR